MRKKFFKLGAIALTMSSAALNVNAQVGINTESPKTTLDIVQRDTATVKGKGFRLIDGNQNSGFVLTSDAAGVGTWRASGVSMYLGYIDPLKADRVPMPFMLATPYVVMPSYIDLPPGLWKTEVCMFLALASPNPSSQINVRVQGSFTSDISAAILNTEFTSNSAELGLSDSNPTYKVINAWVLNNLTSAYLQGTLIIRNTTTSTKRYYFVLRNLEGNIPTPSSAEFYETGAYNASNFIIATPIMSVQ